MPSSYTDEHGNEILVHDNGDPIGQLVQADDGALVLLGFDGQILGAATPDGQELNPADYTNDDPELFRQNLEELNQRLENAQQMMADAQQPPRQDFISDDQLGDDLREQTRSLEKQLGRKLTTPELEALDHVLGHHVLGQGRDVDITAAYELAVAEGAIRELDLDNSHHDRTEWMTQRLHDQEREQQGIQRHEPDQPQHEQYDIDNRDQRQAWMNDQLAGSLDSDTAQAVAYNSSDDAAA